jgi:hypothetical protein
VSDLSDYRLNDRVSSFRIARGELWEVCEHKDFQGRCAVFSGDEPDLSRVAWNEVISSLRPVRREDLPSDEPDREFDRRGRPSAVLYEQRNFRGPARELDRAEPVLPALGDGISSINVRGRAWEICDRPYFAGRCVVISEDVPDLRSYSMEDRVASARPVRRDDNFNAPPRPPYGPSDEPRLILYERPDFRGRAREVTGSEEELSDFNDRAQSARALRGVWQLCEHRNFGGRCVTISGDVRDLNAYRLRDTVTSARPLYDERR